MRVLNEQQREAKRERDRAYYARYVDLRREINRHQRESRKANGKHQEYRSRPEVLEARRKYKEMKRRESGVIPRDGNKKAEAAEQNRLDKAAFVENFIGPPIPSKAMTDAEHYKWRIRNDPDFYAKELDRAQRYKARTRAGYKDSLVKWAEVPQAMKEVKHLQYLISRQLKGTEHENNQRAA